MDSTYHARVIALLDAWTRQRSGLDFGNYGDVAAYRAEQRSITRDLHHYRALRGAVAWREFTPEQWRESLGDAMRAGFRREFGRSIAARWFS